jgi:alpha-tubulin suppressor-like RCC1 family protein
MSQHPHSSKIFQTDKFRPEFVVEQTFPWSSHFKGQLGIGPENSEQSTNRPTKVEIPPVAEITCGWSFVLALTKSGQVYGWGYNKDSVLQVGPGDTIQSPTLSPSLSLARLVSLAAGPYHVLGLQEGASLLSWGWNFFGQLGISREQASTNTHVVIPRDCLNMACGAHISVAQMEDQSLLAWGANSSGQLGLGRVDRMGIDSPTKIMFSPKWNSRVTSFGCGMEHAFLLTENGDLYLWGSEKDGLGLDQTEVWVPTHLQNWKWALPRSFIWGNWESVFQWLFLGMLDKNSPWHKFHVEIIFNFVKFY